MTTTVINAGILNSSEAPPTDYDRTPSHTRMIREMDVYVPMRDGVKICVDIYRPDTTEKLPALLAFAIYNKDFQGPDVNQALPAQPAWTPLWTGPLEAGDHAQHGGLARAGRAEQGEELSLRHLERDVGQGVERLGLLQIAQDAALQQRALQGRELLAAVTAVDLGDVLQLDDRVHTTSANESRRRSNSQ